MSRTLNFYIGDKITRTVNFFTKDPCDSKKAISYPIPAGSVIEAKFPGSVALSTAASEITFTPLENKAIYTIPITKSTSLEQSESIKKSITFIIYPAGDMNAPITFVDEEVLLIKKRPNT